VITAVDTSVLLEVLRARPDSRPASLHTLRRCLAEGSLVACDVVWAEVASEFVSPADCRRALELLSVSYDAIAQTAALAAGTRFRAYRAHGGPRARILPDFLVAEHAAAQADRLLTRDRGFYRSYFKDLVIVDPSVT